MSNLLPSAPHLHAPDSVPVLMRAVLWALLPAILYGIGLFGWPALNLLVFTAVSYTHLDVYKRQALHPGSSGYRLFCLLYTSRCV